MAKSSSPFTKRELNEIAKQRCGQFRNRVIDYRKKCPDEDIDSTKNDAWDMPLVVVACASTKPPYLAETGRNNSELRNCNPILLNAYHAEGVRIGENPSHNIRLFKGEPHYRAGRCAEPHAAHALLNKLLFQNHISIGISDIEFSLAFNCKNDTEHPYCGTCKLVFHQLR